MVLVELWTAYHHFSAWWMEARDRDKVHKKRYCEDPETYVLRNGRDDQICAADRPRL